MGREKQDFHPFSLVILLQEAYGKTAFVAWAGSSGWSAPSAWWSSAYICCIPVRCCCSTRRSRRKSCLADSHLFITTSQIKALISLRSQGFFFLKLDLTLEKFNVYVTGFRFPFRWFSNVYFDQYIIFYPINIQHKALKLLPYRIIKESNQQGETHNKRILVVKASKRRGGNSYTLEKPSVEEFQARPRSPRFTAGKRMCAHARP